MAGLGPSNYMFFSTPRAVATTHEAEKIITSSPENKSTNFLDSFLYLLTFPISLIIAIFTGIGSCFTQDYEEEARTSLMKKKVIPVDRETVQSMMNAEIAHLPQI